MGTESQDRLSNAAHCGSAANAPLEANDQEGVCHISVQTPELVCPVLSRSGCWRGATWQSGRPRRRAGWRRRRATSPCALLRASCAASGPSRALAHSCRSAGLVVSSVARPSQNVSCSSHAGAQMASQVSSLQLPAASEKQSASSQEAHCKLWTLCRVLLRDPAESEAPLQEGGQRRRDAAQEIAAASLVAAVEIYSSMEAAAQLVLEGGSTAASDIAGHK